MQRKVALLDDGEERYGEFRILYVNGQVFLTESVDLLLFETKRWDIEWQKQLRKMRSE